MKTHPRVTLSRPYFCILLLTAASWVTQLKAEFEYQEPSVPILKERLQEELANLLRNSPPASRDWTVFNQIQRLKADISKLDEIMREQAQTKAMSSGSGHGGGEPSLQPDPRIDVASPVPATIDTSSPLPPIVFESKSLDGEFQNAKGDRVFRKDGIEYPLSGQMIDGDVGGLVRRYSRDGGQTGFRVGGDGQVYAFHGNILGPVGSNGTAAIGTIDKNGAATFDPVMVDLNAVYVGSMADNSSIDAPNADSGSTGWSMPERRVLRWWRRRGR